MSCGHTIWLISIKQTASLHESRYFEKHQNKIQNTLIGFPLPNTRGSVIDTSATRFLLLGSEKEATAPPPSTSSFPSIAPKLIHTKVSGCAAKRNTETAW